MITYLHLHGHDSVRYKQALVDLYAAVYKEPPYEEGPEQVKRFRESLEDDFTKVGFSMIAAKEGERIVGATYGWTMPAGRWWSRSDTEPTPPVRESDKFAVMEWIVHPSRRERGIGSALIRKLLAERPEHYATLASDPRSAARAMYERAGWRQVATTSLAWGPVMDLLILEQGTPARILD